MINEEDLQRTAQKLLQDFEKEAYENFNFRMREAELKIEQAGMMIHESLREIVNGPQEGMIQPKILPKFLEWHQLTEPQRDAKRKQAMILMRFGVMF